MNENNFFENDTNINDTELFGNANDTEFYTESFAFVEEQSRHSEAQPAKTEPVISNAAPFTQAEQEQRPIYTYYEPSRYNSTQENYTRPSNAQGYTNSAEYTQNSATERPPVYINRDAYMSFSQSTEQKTEAKKTKSKKGKLGAGAIAAIVALSVVLSGLTSFGVASFMFGKRNASAQSGKQPSVIMQSADKSENASDIVNTDSAQGKMGTYAQVAQKASVSVVEIKTETVMTSSIFSQYITQGAGSGVIITADGYIVTNNHVIEGASNVTVTTKDGKDHKAKVVGYDSESDIAVIKIEAEKLVPAVIGDSNKLVVGEEVVAIGNPLGSLGGTVTNGIISALARDITIDGTQMTLLQTNAAINPGNSGGGLFNLAGELVGIVNAKSSGSGIEGLGFAIPSSTASQVVEQLINYGYVRGRVSLGISYMDIKDSYTAMTYRVDALGMYILGSEHNDELKIGDRVTAINGNVVTYGSDLKAVLKDCKVGDKVKLTVVRDDKYIDIEMECVEYIPGQTSDDTDETQDKSVIGGFSDDFGMFGSPFEPWF